ncbi:MAG: hypothetical protein EBV07_00210 [Proteobacteria bacterium]|nr:hypothetical protein [Pseudomonadota bacterium]
MIIELIIVALGGTLRFGTAVALAIKLQLMKELVIERYGSFIKAEQIQEIVLRQLRKSKSFFALSLGNLTGTGMVVLGFSIGLVNMALPKFQQSIMLTWVFFQYLVQYLTT